MKYAVAYTGRHFFCIRIYLTLLSASIIFEDTNREVCNGKEKKGGVDRKRERDSSGESVSVQIYAEGLFGDTCSVCAPRSDSVSTVVKEVGLRRGGKWAVSKSSFPRGQANPCICEEDPDRMHYMLEQISS